MTVAVIFPILQPRRTVVSDKQHRPVMQFCRELLYCQNSLLNLIEIRRTGMKQLFPIYASYIKPPAKPTVLVDERS